MKAFAEKYKTLLRIMETDPEYAALTSNFKEIQQAWQAAVSELEPAKREIMHEYLGALAEMQMREIELALMLQLQ